MSLAQIVIKWPLVLMSQVRNGIYLPAIAGLGVPYYLYGMPSSYWGARQMAMAYGVAGLVTYGVTFARSASINLNPRAASLHRAPVIPGMGVGNYGGGPVMGGGGGSYGGGPSMNPIYGGGPSMDPVYGGGPWIDPHGHDGPILQHGGIIPGMGGPHFGTPGY